MESVIYSTISELSKSIAARKISATAVLTAHLARAKKLHSQLNAFTHLDVASALSQARAADEAICNNLSLGPLHGIPISIKSCIDVGGWPTSTGSLLRKNEVAAQDAALVTRLKSAGAIVLGHTNTPEFLMHYETANLLHGKTSNPWNLASSSGGSSGGEAAAIASGCTVGGMGSDGGGSIRVPAHFCGIAGLKPTPGRIPSTGHFPRSHELFSWLGVVGPMARTVADLQAIFAVVADPPAHIASLQNTREIRIGILSAENILGVPTHDTKTTVQLAATHLAQLGFAVAPFHTNKFNDLLAEALDLWWFFFGPAVAHLFRAATPGQESQFSPQLQNYFTAAEATGPISEATLRTNSIARDILQKKILQSLEATPILLSPVCLAPAFLHGAGTWLGPSSYRQTMRHSQWLNLVGFPALTLPFGSSSNGLPIGIQLIAQPHREELLLSVAAQLEQSRGPWQFPPPQF